MHLRAMLAAALCAAAIAPAAASASTPEWFPYPAGQNASSAIAADSAGNVWAGGAGNGATPPSVWRLKVAQAVAGTSNGFEPFNTPAVEGEGCCSNQIRGLAYDTTRDRVWYIRSTGVYGFGVTPNLAPNTSNGWSAQRLPSGMDLGGIAIAASGTAWITERSASNTAGWPGNRIFSTGGGDANELPALSEYSGTHQSIRYDAEPTGVTVAPDGGVWFTEADTGNAGYRIAKVAGQSYQEHAITPCESATTPCSGSYTGTGPTSIAAAPGGVLWFTNEIANAVFSFDPDSAVMKRYYLEDLDPALAGGRPRSIRLAPDGTLWVAEYGFVSNPGANAIIRIVPPMTAAENPTADVYKLGAGKTPYAVAPDTKGNVWFVATGDGSGGFVGRLAGVTGAVPQPPAPAGGGGTPLPPPPPASGGRTLTPAGVGISKVEDPKVNADSLVVRQICVGPPEDKCSLVYLLDAKEYVTGFPGTKASLAKKRKTRRVVVGRKTVTLNGGQSKKVVIKLNKKGRKILKRDGKLNATLRVDRKLAGGKKKKLRTKKVVFKKRR